MALYSFDPTSAQTVYNVPYGNFAYYNNIVYYNAIILSASTFMYAGEFTLTGGPFDQSAVLSIYSPYPTITCIQQYFYSNIDTMTLNSPAAGISTPGEDGYNSAASL